MTWTKKLSPFLILPVINFNLLVEPDLIPNTTVWTKFDPQTIDFKNSLVLCEAGRKIDYKFKIAFTPNNDLTEQLIQRKVTFFFIFLYFQKIRLSYHC